MAYEFKLPDIGEGIHEGEIVKWLVKSGDVVAEDQPLLEVMTDKVTAEIPSPISGTVTETRGNEGDIVLVGTVVVVMETASGSTKSTSAPVTTAQNTAAVNDNTPKASTATAVAPRPTDAKVLAAPATRKLSRELGVDLTLVAGSGPRGRVTPDDVRGFSGGAVALPRSTSVVEKRTDKTIPFRGIRRKIAEHLVKSKQTAPHFAYADEVDMTAVVALRQQLKAEAEKRGVKLHYLPFMIKAVIEGLKAYPVLNSTLDEKSEQLIYKGDFNIGVAIDTPEGLIVPVIHQADQYGLLGLAHKIEDLATRARNGQLKPNEMSGGTFTVTSIGSIGGLFGVPIINYPEVAIIGVNKISPKPVVRDGQIVIRDIMMLSISCDHRVVDGAESARFMNTVIDYLQNPARLLCEALQ